MAPSINPKVVSVDLPSEEATIQCASDLVLALDGFAGGIIFLKGELGTGKTSLVRGLIRKIARNHDLEVPSPTFSIVQFYEITGSGGITEVIHADLYRISDARELDELGLSESGEGTIILVEWPENAEGNLGEPDLVLSLETTSGPEGEDGRRLTMDGRPEWIEAIERTLTIRRFLDDAGFSNALREPLTGDASSRSYETITFEGKQCILMNAPSQSDGKPIRGNKPYSRIAKLAEDLSAFVAVDRILESAGLRVPRLYHRDLRQGLLLLEDLGSDKIIDEAGRPISERYLASAAMLADFHGRNAETQVMLEEGISHQVPAYDREAMLIETELLIDWFAPRFKKNGLSKEDAISFRSIWNTLINQLEDSELKIVLRDFHSPNIIWRSFESGHRKVAVIDFQDAVVGPSAYDLASLAQDARVDVIRELEERIVNHYCEQRSSNSEFEENRFRQDYAIMGALRSTKILGIFVRLDERDGKSAYIAHLPRIQEYLKRSLEHPVLANYRAWCECVMDL